MKTIVFFVIAMSQSLCAWHCPSIPLATHKENNESIQYISCFPAQPFEYAQLPLTNDHYLHPYQGVFDKTFILRISNGWVFGHEGWVLLNGATIHELIWQNVFLSTDLYNAVQEKDPLVINGRVAVIGQSGYGYYYHWMVEVLGRLALLEMHGIEYDFLYVPQQTQFMKESLELWGIDACKIISASNDQRVIAHELIVPSLVSKAQVNGCPRLVHYVPEYIVNYIRKKLLEGAQKRSHTCEYNKKIFISRKDAASRKIINEDDIFPLFHAAGFTRYYLTQMSLAEQVQLFKNAEIIVGPIGSGLTNIIFCNPGVKIIELYQARRDSTIWNLSYLLGLNNNHYCVRTTDFIDEREGQYDTMISVDVANDIIVRHCLN